jgi:hypothetical protein
MCRRKSHLQLYSFGNRQFQSTVGLFALLAQHRTTQSHNTRAAESSTEHRIAGPTQPPRAITKNTSWNPQSWPPSRQHAQTSKRWGVQHNKTPQSGLRSGADSWKLDLQAQSDDLQKSLFQCMWPAVLSTQGRCVNTEAQQSAQRGLQRPASRQRRAFILAIRRSMPVDPYLRSTLLLALTVRPLRNALRPLACWAVLLVSPLDGA